MALGSRVLLPDGNVLSFTQVLEDSRCPPNVQCIWAGQARVAFSVIGAQTTDLRILLSPAQGEGVAGATRVRVLDLTPRSGATQASSPEVTVVIEPAGAASTGIFGMVTVGPMCPVQRIDQPCPDRPLAATLVIRDAAGSEVARATSDSAGFYALALRAGHYRVTPLTPGGGPLPRGSAFEVDVTAAMWTLADVSYDSGIR